MFEARLLFPAASVTEPAASWQVTAPCPVGVTATVKTVVDCAVTTPAVPLPIVKAEALSPLTASEVVMVKMMGVALLVAAPALTVMVGTPWSMITLSPVTL